jgi:hypothetical protein
MGAFLTILKVFFCHVKDNMRKIKSVLSCFTR